MSRKSTSVVALLACAVLVFAATGCGSKKSASTTVAAAPPEATETISTDTTATDTTATDTTATETTATDTTATDTTVTDTTATDTSATDTTAPLSVASAANCLQLEKLGQTFSKAFSGTGTEDLAKESELMKEFADQTPADIRPDFEIIAKDFTQIAEALKGVNLKSGQVPSADQLAKITQLSSKLDSAELTKAEADISTWASKNCTGG